MKLTIALIAIVGSLLCISPIFGKEELQCKSNQECIKLRDCTYTKKLLARVLSSSDGEETNNMIAEMRKLVCNPLDTSVCCNKVESEVETGAKGDHEESDAKVEGDNEASEPEAESDHEESEPEYSGDYYYDSEVEAEGDHEESEAVAEGSDYYDQNKIMDTLGRPIRCQILNPIAKRDLREDNSDHYGYSNPSPYNYCVKARVGNHIIRGIGIQQFDPASIGITSDTCKDNFSLNIQTQLGSDAVFDRICVCFSDNCNEGKIEVKDDHDESNPEAEGDHVESEPEASGDYHYESEPEYSGDYFYDSEVEAEGDQEESEAVAEGSDYDDQNKIMDTSGRPIRCQILNPIAKRDLREDNSDHYEYSNPSPYNYCVKARVGNHIIRGIGIQQFDPASIGITSDTCKDDFSPNIETQLGSDTVFDRICVCFSDNCNGGEI